MNCLYCQQEARKVASGNDGIYREEFYLCDGCNQECQVWYFFFHNTLTRIDLSGIKIRNKKYMVRILPNDNCTLLLLWKTINHASSIPCSTYRIFAKIDHKVDWTPTNVKDKLKFLLPYL